MTVFERTKETAKQKGLSLVALEERAGLSEKSLYKWKRSNPSSDNLQKVADVLHVSTDYLLGRTDDMNTTTVETVKKADIDDSDLLLAFDGKDIDEEDKQAIIDLLMFRRYKRRNEGK